MTAWPPHPLELSVGQSPASALVLLQHSHNVYNCNLSFFFFYWSESQRFLAWLVQCDTMYTTAKWAFFSAENCPLFTGL